MKPKTRKIPEREYDALTEMIYKKAQPVIPSPVAGTSVFMLDSDFLTTQSMAEIRWIMTDSPYDTRLFQIDGAGDAILLIRD